MARRLQRLGGMNTNAYEQGKVEGYETQMPQATASAWGKYLLATADLVGPRDYITEMSDFGRGVADGYAAWKKAHPFSVCEWCSHPDDGNDDCNTGMDYATVEEAREAFLAAFPRSAAFIELDGPGVREVRRNPVARRRTAERDHAHDRAWRHEIAMEAGMAFGCDGYNDAMGF